jgi:hypothetical protein
MKAARVRLPTEYWIGLRHCMLREPSALRLVIGETTIVQYRRLRAGNRVCGIRHRQDGGGPRALPQISSVRMSRPYECLTEDLSLLRIPKRLTARWLVGQPNSQQAADMKKNPQLYPRGPDGRFVSS